MLNNLGGNGCKSRLYLSNFKIVCEIPAVISLLRQGARTCSKAQTLAPSMFTLLMHNHPSGDPTPSEADIKVTRDLIRAGQLIKIDVLDHVIMGSPKHSSLRELGYFYN